LIFHQWFNNSKCILCYHKRTMVCKSRWIAQTCWPLNSKAKCGIPKSSTIQRMWIFSCFNSNHDLKAQKLLVVNLEIWSQYILMGTHDARTQSTCACWRPWWRFQDLDWSSKCQIQAP
jgi:hypothetical protein